MRLAPAYRVVLFAAGLFVAWTLFWQLSVVMLTVLLAVIVALPLAASTDWLARRRVPRPVGAIATLLVALAVVAGAFALLAPTLTAQLDRLVAQLPAVVTDLRSQIRSLGLDGGSADAGVRFQALVQGYLDDPARLVGPVRIVVTNTLTALGGLLLVLLTALYAASNPQPLVGGLIALVPPAGRNRARHILSRLRDSWLGWLKGTAIDMVLTGLLTFAALSVIGLEHAVVFAALTALLELVPYLGPILAAIPPVLFALTQSVELAALTLAAYTVVQQVEGNVIVPLVMSQAVGLPPALLAFGVVIIGSLFGLMGVLLAVPLLSAVVILVQELWIAPNEARAARDPPGRTGARSGPELHDGGITA
jgi:predicted PurR-regulated permease PerM